MTSQLTALAPSEVAARMRTGAAHLVDIREHDEFAREHIAGAAHAPLSTFEVADLTIAADRQVIFMCRTGNRTGANCQRLAARVDGPAFVLDGGLDAWKQVGLPTQINAKAPLEMMRQVQIGAGSLILMGAGLGMWMHPGFWAIAAFVGVGLLLAGVTGFCGMARVLGLMPWNRSVRA